MIPFLGQGPSMQARFIFRKINQTSGQNIPPYKMWWCCKELVDAQSLTILYGVVFTCTDSFCRFFCKTPRFVATSTNFNGDLYIRKYVYIYIYSILLCIPSILSCISPRISRFDITKSCKAEQPKSQMRKTRLDYLDWVDMENVRNPMPNQMPNLLAHGF